ncbi:MAG: hypothetical protein WA973_18085 [Mesorhizobium sp.]
MKEALERLLADSEKALVAAQHMFEMTSEARPELFTDPEALKVALVSLFSGEVAVKEALIALLRIEISKHSDA